MTTKIPLSPQAEADRKWLSDRLGARFGGVYVQADGEYQVELVRLDGRRHWCFGGTAEAALRRARDTVENTAVNRRVS